MSRPFFAGNGQLTRSPSLQRLCECMHTLEHITPHINRNSSETWSLCKNLNYGSNDTHISARRVANKISIHARSYQQRPRRNVCARRSRHVWSEIKLNRMVVYLVGWKNTRNNAQAKRANVPCRCCAVAVIVPLKCNLILRNAARGVLFSGPIYVSHDYLSYQANDGRQSCGSIIAFHSQLQFSLCRKPNITARVAVDIARAVNGQLNCRTM